MIRCIDALRLSCLAEVGGGCASLTLEADWWLYPCVYVQMQLGSPALEIGGVR